MADGFARTAAAASTAAAGTVAATSTTAGTTASAQRASAAGLRLGTVTRAAARTTAFDALQLLQTQSRTTTTAEPLLRGLEQAFAATRAQGAIDVLIAQRLLTRS